MNPQPSKSGKRHNWTRRQIAMLGTIPDAALSRKLDLHLSTVLKKRQKLGITASRPPKTIHWTPDVIGLLGKIPDGEVALRTGINKASVYWKRCKLKIPSFTQKRPKKLLTDWTLKEIAVLGKMTDAAAAAALDVAPSAVRLKRISLGIPPIGRASSH